MEAKTEVESIPPVIAKGLPVTAEAAKEIPVTNEDNVPDVPDVTDVVAPQGYVYEGRGKDTSRDTKSVRAYIGPKIQTQRSRTEDMNQDLRLKIMRTRNRLQGLNLY